VAVELFVSYYNHYVPESFETTASTPKKVSVNADIDVLDTERTGLC
jgi:excinuclease UvrABC helicase subunit UvrB